ncbi:D-TA family PLP-dependent enzyme [Ochrobactrum sp. AN78]|uniref:D-TA family PLP-dependent enzyme n=1 Tax=Ochrobactrum sp. AN78 TaxID=3039853 RepID=UPI002989F421|nr:D-TA family PLP-dependent enzyme [Ochrobactrum sp. AN78]MDH7790780.1 D-serine deaminase-like pyridoxal phosphate-dependent protein [Ochrobactrum sp. AN78]
MTRPKTVYEIDTPAILIDVNRVQANIKKAQAHADAIGVKLRPHIKTHKLPFFARRQIEAGAVGITCQKLGEAEVMADAGIIDIFLPYNILGKEKLERLYSLHQRITISVTVDNATSLDGLEKRFTNEGRPLTVLVECDTGMGRCGVQTPEEALELARHIDQSKGLKFGGLMTYPATGKAEQAEQWLVEARNLLAANGLQCETISSGGTPDMWRSPKESVVTEYRPGTYIYFDRYQVGQGAATLDDCALTVLSTIVSHPTLDRAIIDAGSKSLSSDTLGLADFGELAGRPDARVTGLSEEHGTLKGDIAGLKVGDKVRVIPDHVCVVSNLFDEVHLISGDDVIDILPVAARGKLN